MNQMKYFNQSRHNLSNSQSPVSTIFDLRQVVSFFPSSFHVGNSFESRKSFLLAGDCLKIECNVQQTFVNFQSVAY